LTKAFLKLSGEDSGSRAAAIESLVLSSSLETGMGEGAVLLSAVVAEDEEASDDCRGGTDCPWGLGDEAPSIEKLA
jgi:hypothetical protein